MKKRKWLIPLLLVIVIVIVISIFTYKNLTNETKLSSEERTWINDNINDVQNVYVVKDENVFSKNGEGVFYDFLTDFSEEYSLQINSINLETNNNVEGVVLGYSSKIIENAKLFYTDHYVLISKNNEIVNNTSVLENKNIGMLNIDAERFNTYFKDININFLTYETVEDLFKGLDADVNYVIVPRIKYLDQILSNNFNMIYHFSDMNNYYYLKGNDDILSSIMAKCFEKWIINVDDNIKKEEFLIFTKSLNISDTEIDKLLSVDYRYGFINNSPYEVIMSGNYGGIIAEYLQDFSEFTGVYFDITKYKNINKLAEGINRGKVDLYFAFNEKMENDYIETVNGVNSSLAILTAYDSEKVISSIYGLVGETVYVENNSNLYKYLKNIDGINIETYETSKELFKLNKQDVIIVMDKYIFDYYKDTKLNNYKSQYDTLITDKYTFKVNKENTTLLRLLDKYVEYLDNNYMINQGINSHIETVENGNILNAIAKYFIISIVVGLLIALIVYKNTKKIRIAKRIKKEDKIRFIDELTCLKNRSYLSDFIKTWNNNTVYPQTVIVMDLNKLKEINEQYGVTEGDKQIQGAANALIKTQLDNSDLMRSDGNEFVIYTVGYNQKQIINYIHKLNKELKKLPYNYGAEFGYSIIESNVKTVEDALTEAIEDMKSKKVSGESEKKNK